LDDTRTPVRGDAGMTVYVVVVSYSRELMGVYLTMEAAEKASYTVWQPCSIEEWEVVGL
jgi:hypothetical protein